MPVQSIASSPVQVKKTRQWASFDSLGAIHQAGFLGQLNDVRIAKDLQMGLRKVVAQGGNRRQGQNEVANGSSANHQNLPAHQNFTNPSRATKRPKANLMPQPTFILFSLAVLQASKSRKRQGEMVSHMPARTRT